MQKDFDLIMQAAHDLRTPLFTSAIAHQVYTAANVAGYGDLDYSAVVQFLEAAASMDLERPEAVPRHSSPRGGSGSVRAPEPA